MNRRLFLLTVLAAPLGILVVGHPRSALARRPRRGGPTPAPDPTPTPVNGNSLQSFGYYEGLGETEQRDPSRTDGTTYNMPCITAADIQAGVDKGYTFWHGHDGMNHLFTLTAADFAQLQAGKDVETFTTLVEDHRHSLLVSPASPCESTACRELGAHVRVV